MVRYGPNALERTCFTNNISLSGAFLRTNNVFKPGTTIQVEFEFPDRKVNLWAQVVWAKKVPPQMAHVILCGMGVRFINPGQEWAEVFGVWQAKKA
jgi:Tfp pilus assembly protein PilZ